MSGIYTRTGDAGETGLGNGQRVRKDCTRVEAYGTLDELNSALGLSRALMQGMEAAISQELTSIHHDLFCLGSRLAVPHATDQLPPVPVHRIPELERAIDRMTARMPPLAGFILPGGTQEAASVHVARTICRRAERRLVALCAEAEDAPDVAHAQRYLNRLADYLFTLARYANFLKNHPDEHWNRGQEPDAEG